MMMMMKPMTTNRRSKLWMHQLPYRWSTMMKSCMICFIMIMLFDVHGVYGGKSCSLNSIYQCPNCGGIEVDDCFDCTGYISTDNTHNICFNRVLFQRRNTDPTDYENHYHFLWNDIVAAFIWFFVAGVAISCGVGGGGIFVPLGVLLLRFSPKQASGLSQCSIFGCTLGGLLLNAQGKHPNEHITDEPGIPDDHGRYIQDMKQTTTTMKSSSSSGPYYTRPVIHYDMVLFLAPMEIAGALTGVIIQQLIPNWLYLIVATLVLAFTAYKTYGKYLMTRQKEKLQEEEQRHTMTTTSIGGDNNSDHNNLENNVVVAVDNEQSDETNNITNTTGDDMIEKSNLTELNTNSDKSSGSDTSSSIVVFDDTIEIANLRKQYLLDDMRQYPKEKIIALVMIWVIIFVITMFRGGKGVPSLIGITCESVWYGILIALQFTSLLLFACYFGKQLLYLQKQRLEVRYPFQVDDTVWDFKALQFYGFCTFIAGIVAGLIGIGGGMILGPLMLVMGLHPRVSSASTATMIVLTSSSVAVLFVTSGIVPWSYALFFFSVCFMGAVVNKRMIDNYVKRTGRASLLIFILATIIAIATVGCTFNLFSGLAAKDWCLDGFKEFCKVSHDEECPVDRFLSHGVSFLSH